ncbi:40S ribosomal protein S6 [Paramarasmius palmivorus]|uniref:40S ribosomal protein S6 n=1 Tax=Paramarasmius palmivorus TaxID=297713 RepID=A0AAW0AWP1_9AGAR
MNASSTDLKASTVPTNRGLDPTAIPHAADDDQTVVIVVAVFFVLVLALHRYLRRLYPCLTIADLNGAETLLDDTFVDAIQHGYLRGYEQDVINRVRLSIKNKASEIRSRRLQSPASVWRKCLNIEVELFADMVLWYGEVEELQREILTIVELEKRYQYNVELGRYAMLATTV